ncbi:hypothetical protein [Rhodovulum sp. YEN HP10]
MTDMSDMKRHSFLKRSARACRIAESGTLAAPAVLAGTPIVLKMQTS